MLKFALIGFGGYGWKLGELIRKLGTELDCSLVAAADARVSDFADKAAQLRQVGVQVYDDAMKMLRDLKGQCDAVYIATSIHSHRPLLLAAVREGYHVHLEKPAAATVQEVDEMIQAVRAAGKICMVGFQAQHGPDIRFIKDRIMSGRLGDVRSGACHAGWPRPRSYYARNEWAGKLRRGDAWVLDGPAMNALAHQTMNLLQLVSRHAPAATPTAVRAELYAAGPVESHDTAAIEIATDAGAKCYLLLSHCTDASWHPTIDMECTLGRVTWRMGKGAEVVYADGKTESCASDDSQHPEMIRNFVQTLRNDDPWRLRVDLPMARQMVLALDGAHESSQTIHRVPAQFTRTVGDDPRTVVQGLDDMLRAAAAARCLLSDLPDAPPWTVRTEPFDLKGYGAFPVRFH